MRVEMEIPDERLQNVNPDKFQEWLKNHGWQEDEEWTGCYRVFVKDLTTALIPTNPKAVDFAKLTGFALGKVATAEQINPETILNQICDES